MNIILDETGRRMKCSAKQFKDTFEPRGYRCTDEVKVEEEEVKLEAVKATPKKKSAPKTNFLEK